MPSSQIAIFPENDTAAEIVEGIVDHVVYQNKTNFWTVAKLKSTNGGTSTITGILNDAILGKTIRAEGHYQTHPKYGQQFKIDSFKEIEPETEEGLIAFLSGKKFKGIGPKKAEATVHMFGAKTLEVLENNPELAAKLVKPLKLSEAKNAQKVIIENAQLIHVIAKLRDLNLTETMAAKAADTFGLKADEIVKENPYRLTEIDGIGFKKADEIALHNGIEIDSKIRIRNALLFVLQDETNTHGHVYLPENVLVHETEVLLFGLDPDDPPYETMKARISDNLNYLVVEGKICITRPQNDWRRIYLPNLYRNERDVALDLMRLSASCMDPLKGVEKCIADSELEVGIECGKDVTFDNSQLKAIYDILTEPLAVLTGGPGTGKTTIIRTLVKIFEKNGLHVSLAAPTGRAAKRMKESCHREAYTIHKLLGFRARGSEEKGQGSLKGVFTVNHNSPLLSDVVIVDESSMIDLPLMAHLLDALQNGTRVIFVGDVEQLPPVGPGQPFADIISGNYAKVVRLQTPHRQANGSTLPMVAHQILEGYVPSSKRYRDFTLLPAEDTEDIAKKLVTLLQIYHDKGGTLDDLQILCPLKKGQAGTQLCNLRAQAIFNPPSPEKAEYKRYFFIPDPEHPGKKQRVDAFYRVGDKVIQIKNQYSAHKIGEAWADPNTGEILIRPVENEKGFVEDSVSNGEIGKIYAIKKETAGDAEKTSIEILYDDGRLIKYEESDFQLFQHAFAITIHKSQGCEFKSVLISLPGGSPDFINRQLIYTAVTRAKQNACVIGKPQNLVYAVKNNKSRKRNSGLSA